MKNLNRKLLLILISFSVVPIWGLLLLSADFANVFTAFACLVLTILGTIVVSRSKLFKTNNAWMLLSIGPIFYLGSLVVLTQSISDFILSPILWAFGFFVIALNLKSIKNWKLTLPTIFVVFVYSFFIGPFSYPVFGTPPEKNIKAFNLKKFEFLNYEGDSLRFSELDRPMVIETWNETCPPCIQSIKDLEEEFTNQDSIIHIYLYQYRGKRRLTEDQIFDYKFIKSKSRIFVDINNELFNQMELNAYPYFLVFNASGELAGFQSGYNSKEKEAFLKNLRDNIRKGM